MHANSRNSGNKGYTFIAHIMQIFLLRNLMNFSKHHRQHLHRHIIHLGNAEGVNFGGRGIAPNAEMHIRIGLAVVRWGQVRPGIRRVRLGGVWQGVIPFNVHLCGGRNSALGAIPREPEIRDVQEGANRQKQHYLRENYRTHWHNGLAEITKFPTLDSYSRLRISYSQLHDCSQFCVTLKNRTISGNSAAHHSCRASSSQMIH